MIPVLGAIFLVLSALGSAIAWRAVQLTGYWHQIDAARHAGKDVEEKDVSIRLGSPVIARFRQPGLMWAHITFVGYDESDGMADQANLDEACAETASRIFGHFYFIDTGC